MAETRLSVRQMHILDYIIRYWFDNRMSPSVRDIVAGCGGYLADTHAQLQTMVHKGYVRHAAGRGRGYVPVRDTDGTPIQIIFRRADGIEVIV